MLSFEQEIILPADCGETFAGLAFDGCRYYLTVRCACAIVILDPKCCRERRAVTCRPYAAICFDPRRNGFWAVSPQCPGTLFRLDRSLREVDRLALCCSGEVQSVSFCCDCGQLLLVCGGRLVKLCPDSGIICPLWAKTGCTPVLAAACLPPFLMFTTVRGGRGYFVLADEMGCPVEEQRSETALAVDGMLFCGVLLVLTHRHGCYPRLLKLRLRPELEKKLAPCAGKCQSCDREEKCPNGCGAVLESVALMEAALAHILNGEGEKLQSAIAGGAAPEQLLAINHSVQQTILNATQLEQVLLSKLEALAPLCGKQLCPEEPQRPFCGDEP